MTLLNSHTWLGNRGRLHRKTMLCIFWGQLLGSNTDSKFLILFTILFTLYYLLILFNYLLILLPNNIHYQPRTLIQECGKGGLSIPLV